VIGLIKLHIYIQFPCPLSDERVQLVQCQTAIVFGIPVPQKVQIRAMKHKDFELFFRYG
jgi:hypothetical protein